MKRYEPLNPYGLSVKEFFEACGEFLGIAARINHRVPVHNRATDSRGDAGILGLDDLFSVFTATDPE